MEWNDEGWTPPAEFNLSEISKLKGKEIGCSRNLVISQDMITAFGRLTGDEQYIHTNPVRAKKGPFGGTIAHGFLTLSLFSALSFDAIPRITESTASINYGFDRIRMINPIKTGESISARFTLMDIVTRGENRVMLRLLVELRARNTKKPAVLAEWLILHMLKNEEETAENG